jgi:hypothetical protein
VTFLLLPHPAAKVGTSNAAYQQAEQAGEVVYFIASGTVKVHVEQADGRDVLIALLGPGEVVGELSVFDCHERCDAPKIYFAARIAQKIKLLSLWRPTRVPTSTAWNSSSTCCQRSGFITVSLAELLIEPGLGQIPIAHHRLRRDAQDLRGFFYRQPAEVTQLDDVALALV